MFQLLRHRVGDISKLKTVISDFERAVFSAVYHVFPGVTQRGCNFHYTAAVYKNVGAKGLQSLHYSCPGFQELIYMLYGLAYVPVDKVVDIYTELLEPQFQVLIDEDEDVKIHEENIESFITYFRNTWISKRNGRAPMFEPIYWNQVSALEDNGHRTNNHLESFNRTLNSLVGTKPNIWGVLENFVSIEADSRRVFLNDAVGQDMHVNTEKLQLLVQSFGRCPDQEYIQKVAHILSDK